MMCHLRRGSPLALAVVLSAATALTSQASERVLLDRATILTDLDQPSFVHYAVEELADYLKESTGHGVPVVASSDKAGQVQILVGAKAARRVFPDIIPDASLGEEGYALKAAAKDGVDYVVATGSTPRGTKLALALLLKSIQVDRTSAFVPASLNVLGKPAFAKRGMHLNGWPLNYPYSFRCWREADWQRYLDILSCQGVNLFYLWPFLEIMPVPFSPEDQAYLEECRRVIDYAQKKHGMEVWIMQCTNRVAKDRCGADDPRVRPYWRPAQEDLNPGKPEDFQAIVASREALYRILDNADGVCNIDSDPGFCPNSTVSDYVKVLQACRALLDRHNIHGKEAKLINWMLWGWGMPGVGAGQTEGLVQRELQTLQGLKQGLPEPLWLISGQFPEYLPMCRKEGLISKTVYLPYGAIECEPAYPRTTVQIEAIRGMYSGADASSPDIAGIMGNVQTPLLQFPNLFYFTSVWCDSDYRSRSGKDVLLELAGHLYPDHRQLIADCYLALSEPDPAKIGPLAERLNDVLREDTFGRLGVFGRKLFPDHRVAAKSLYLQLRMRAARECLLQCITPTTPRAECVRLLADYLDAYLCWDLAHGWHGLWGWNAWWLGADTTPSAIAQSLRKALTTEADINTCLAEVAKTLSAKHADSIVQQGCLEPIKTALPALAGPVPATPKP